MDNKIKIMPEERQWIHREFGRLSQYGSLSETIAELQAAINAEQAGVWKDLSIQIEIDNDYGDITNYIAICGRRLETDNELAVRLAADKQVQKSEREEYLRLKKKFEG